MQVSHRIFTRKGALSTENRDIAGHAVSGEMHLFVLIDGSSRPGSGELAHAFCEHLVTAFPRLCDAGFNLDNAPQRLSELIEDGRQALCPSYPRAKASILVMALGGDGAAAVLHAGDCCLGVMTEARGVEWLTSPHCASNWQGGRSHAEIATDPQRHLLTRCITVRRRDDLAIERYQLTGVGSVLLGTDGFWACFSQDQQAAAISEWSFSCYDTDDDVTVVEICVTTD